MFGNIFHSTFLKLEEQVYAKLCWTKDFCPLWCGCEEPKTMTCEDLSEIQANFVMNENWLDDFCDNRLYSMLIREPISRAMSHVNQFLDALAARDHKPFHNTKGWRLSLIQSNYMTWSLTAGELSDLHPKYFRPTKDHMDNAKKKHFLVWIGVGFCVETEEHFFYIFVFVFVET